jgi:membrane protein DedA with SNARE-associated domain
MNLPGLIAEYGYGALFVGSLLEGETLLILAGFAVHQGYLQLHWVILTAMFGGFLGDQFYFWVGRRHGAWVLRRFPRIIPVVKRTDALIERHPRVIIVMIRFLYGLRTVGPFAIGISTIKTKRFVLLNALGAAIWAVSIGWAGYVFGQAMAVWLDNLQRVEETLLVILLFGGLIFAGWRHWRAHKKSSR